MAYPVLEFLRSLHSGNGTIIPYVTCRGQPRPRDMSARNVVGGIEKINILDIVEISRKTTNTKIDYIHMEKP